MTQGHMILAIVAFCYTSSRIFQPLHGTIPALRESAGQGLPIMRALRDQPALEAENHLRLGAIEEESELALLAQFLRHDSVASLAIAIAERKGVRSRDLIAAAGLDPSRIDR